ncbi:MAG: WecB/TagA/CpsF family glycosyltransferase [Chloroflexota bacterium]|nr:MAG: WecB/TagA/CpsF family glycosyltransferase [Chloroflexota bacterium]
MFLGARHSSLVTFLNSITLLGVRVDDVTMTEALAQVDDFMQEPRVHQVVTVNPEFVTAAQNNAEFARALAQSDLNLPDGANLLRAAQAQGTPLRERVAGTDFVWYLSGLAAISGWKVFLLGGRGGVGGQAAARLQARYRNLKIVGMFEGSPDERDEAEILARLDESGAEILFVAFGSPAQDLWIYRNRGKFRTVRVALGIGGAFDFIAKKIRRAPKWMQDIGLEWLFRLVLQPWRVRRQWALVIFTLKMARQNRNLTKMKNLEISH